MAMKPRQSSVWQPEGLKEALVWISGAKPRPSRRQGQTEQLQTLLLQAVTNRQVAVAQQRVWQVALEVHVGKQPAISCAPFIGLLKSSSAGAS
jgi:hypothetical protein